MIETKDLYALKDTYLFVNRYLIFQTHVNPLPQSSDQNPGIWRSVLQRGTAQENELARTTNRI